MALMVLNNLYVSECTAPSVRVSGVREQLGQSGRKLGFITALKWQGTSFRLALHMFGVGFSKRSKGNGVIKALRERNFCLSIVHSHNKMSQNGSLVGIF